MEYVAVLAGAVVWFALGAVWYMLLAKPWMAGAGLTEAQVESGSKVVTFGTAMVAILFGSVMLNQVYNLADVASLTEALRLGLYIGLGMGLVIVVLNTMYGMRGKSLIWIDGGYAIIGGVVVMLVRNLIAG